VVNDIEKSVLESRNQYCQVCNKNGASLKCVVNDCEHYYHFPCAAIKETKIKLSFKNIEVYCNDHEQLFKISRGKSFYDKEIKENEKISHFLNKKKEEKPSSVLKSN
jgi:hypothetical protein